MIHAAKFIKNFSFPLQLHLDLVLSTKKKKKWLGVAAGFHFICRPSIACCSAIETVQTDTVYVFNMNTIWTSYIGHVGTVMLTMS